MFKAEIKVTLKPGVLDPQAKAIADSLSVQGFSEVDAVRVGKYIEVILEADTAEAAASRVAEMGRQLLANPVTENFSFTLTPLEGEA